MNIEEVFKFPLKRRGDSIVTNDGFTTLMFLMNITNNSKDSLLDIINGISKPTMKRNVFYKNGVITANINDRRTAMFIVMGRIYLTEGPLKLPVEEAKKVQVKFAEFIASKLSGN